MIVSIDWLKDFVRIDESVNDLADLLSSIGLESEVIGTPSDIKNVVVGKIIDINKHPNADKLNICTIFDGVDNVQVICGASNIKINQIIAFAKVGSILFNGFKIKKEKIRGIESFGMVCSEKELGISDYHDGILELAEDYYIGEDFIESYSDKNAMIEIDVTPNRPDAFSHIGVARDIASKTNRAFSFKIPPIKKIGEKYIDISINVESFEDCPRYVCAIVKNIKVQKSPKWLIDRLESIGQRSINNIVDISNYVLMEMGQPTHIFDYDKLAGGEISIRRAHKSEKITSLDGVERILDNNTLLITNNNNPVAVAGIIGGLTTSVSKDTKTIFIESAYFNPVTIRKSSKNLGLSTEASKRYERGADPHISLQAFWRLIELLNDVSNIEIVSDVHDIKTIEFHPPTITVRESQIEQVLGVNISSSEISRILNTLSFEVYKKKDSFECKPPSFRPDVEREIDVIEEVARIYGFDNIPSDNNIYGSFPYGVIDPQEYLNSIRSKLSGAGFYQVYSNSLLNEVEATLFDVRPVRMLNPLSQDMAILRTSLLPGLLKFADFNIKNGTQNFRLYEIGNVHNITDNKNNFKESFSISGIVYGSDSVNSVHKEIVTNDFYSIKGLLSELFIKKIKFKSGDSKIHEISYDIYLNKKKIGSFGKVHSNLISKLNLNIRGIYSFEIDANSLKNNNEMKDFIPINYYPIVSRKINLVMSENDEVGPILNTINEVSGSLLTSARPISIFRDSESIGENKKSVSFEMTFQSSERTLEDVDVNPIIDEIILIVKKDFNAKLRL